MNVTPIQGFYIKSVVVFQLDAKIALPEADRRERKYRWIHLVLMWLTVFFLAEMNTARADVKSLDGTIIFDSLMSPPK